MPSENTHPSQKSSNVMKYAVDLYREEAYKDAHAAFTQWISTNQNATPAQMKSVVYNRARCSYQLAQKDPPTAVRHYKMSLADAEECIRIDRSWMKGHKCKVLALEGLGRKHEAMDYLLDSTKLNYGIQDWDDDFADLAVRLNEATGFLEGDLRALIRTRRGEKFCERCKVFDGDADGSFLTCRCFEVHYCCVSHQKEDASSHKAICKTIEELHKDESTLVQVSAMNVGSPDTYLLILHDTGKLPEMPHLWKMKTMHAQQQTPQMRKWMAELEAQGCNDSLVSCIGRPVQISRPFSLSSWDALFNLAPLKAAIDSAAQFHGIYTMMKNAGGVRGAVGDLTGKTRKALALALTDPMTVLFALARAELNMDQPTLHIVGAEPDIELQGATTFGTTLTSICGIPDLYYIGPQIPIEYSSADPHCFTGTYQRFVRLPDYKPPTMLVAFFAGMHDPTYQWKPVLDHAVNQRIPFLMTANFQQDFEDLTAWLKRECSEEVDIYPNPFASTKATYTKDVSKPHVLRRNMYCALLVPK